MKRSLLFLLVAVLVLLLIGAVPATGQISVRSGLSVDVDVDPGSTHKGSILVRNETSVPQQAKIYQTDYLFFQDGSNVFGQTGSVPRSNATWITFSPSVLTLPPGETLPVSYEIQVPDNGGSALDGSFWSMLMVEGIPSGSPESTLDQPEERRRTVRQVMRYGVQVATHVRGTGRRSVRFTESGLVREDGGKTYLQIGLENDGTLMVRPEVSLELYDQEGKAWGRRQGVPTRIYPGTSIKEKIDLGSLPSSTYQAVVIVDLGDDDLVGARYTLKL